MAAYEIEPALRWRKTSPLSAQARQVLQALEFRAGQTEDVARVLSSSERQVERTLRSLARRSLVHESAAGWTVTEKGLEALA